MVGSRRARANEGRRTDERPIPISWVCSLRMHEAMALRVRRDPVRMIRGGEEDEERATLRALREKELKNAWRVVACPNST